MNIPKISLRDPRFRGWLALGLLIALGLTLLYPLVFARDARILTAYGSSDDDLSQFRSEVQATGAPIQAIFSTANLLRDVDATKTLLVIVGTERPYDPTEAQAIKDLLAAGGHVILADDTGYGTDITRDAIGYRITEPKQHVIDTVNGGSVDRPVAYATLDGTQYRLEFANTSAVVPFSNAVTAETIAASSVPRFPNGSYLDLNEDRHIEIGDAPCEPCALIVRADVGTHGGKLVVLGDATVLANEQMGLADYDNARFARALVQSMLPDGGTVLIDESRHPPVFWIAPWENAVRSLGRVATGDATPFILVALLVVGTLVAWALTRPTEDWSVHAFDASRVLHAPESLRPDLARAQRMARHRISERYNIPLEQVAAMTTEELVALCSDKTLAEAASGALRSDPSPLFQSFSTPPESSP